MCENKYQYRDPVLNLKVAA